jgi:hypothetical protein
MPYNLLILPLIGGFLFVHVAHYFRFAAQRMDGYRLLFQAAIAGVALSIVGRLADILIGLSPIGHPLWNLWNTFSPFPYSATSAISLLLGPVFALLLNLFISREKAKDMEIRAHGSSLLKLLHRAANEKRLISLTLDSRKWYVGWVAESPNLDPLEQYFKLLPFISGYRDKDALETRRTVYYDAVLKDPLLDPNEFVITLPLKDVKIAGFFNDQIYDEYFAEPDPDPEDSFPKPLVN